MKRRTIWTIWLVAAAVMVLVPAARADTLQLKDGRLIHGEFFGGTKSTINFQVGGKLESYRVADVMLLSFGDESPSSSTTTTPQDLPQTALPSSSSPSAATIPAGTRVQVRMIDTVNSETSRVGDRFQASLEQDLAANGTVVAPKGANVYGRLIEAKEAGKLSGHSELRLELTGITVNQRVLPIVTGDYEVAGKSRTKDTATKVGGGAAIGAIIGAIAGGGKGAAIGAGVGGGAGTAVQVLTQGQQVNVPSETVLDFALLQPLIVPATEVAGH